MHSNHPNSKFIALMVSEGDAFYLEKNERSVLVDGGDKTKNFPLLFYTTTGQKGSDILVCTHNDADHAYGLIDFLESGFTVKEVWLPGSWMDKIPEIIRDPEEIIQEIVQEDISKKIEGLHSISEYGDALSEKIELVTSTKTPQITAETITQTLVENSDEGDVKSSGLLDYLSLNSKYTFFDSITRSYLPSFRVNNLLFQLIKSMERIRRIAILAYNVGAKIR